MTSPFKTFRLGGKCKRLPRKQTTDYKIACKLRSTVQWQNLRDVYKTDNPMCQDCGVKASAEVHHIMSVAKYPELCFELQNLRALCVDCHEERHRQEKQNAGN